MKLEKEYSSQDLNETTKYTINNRISQQIVIDLNDLKKIESLVDKDLIKISEDNKNIVIELNKEKIKEIQENLDKNNIKYKNFVCLDDKKVEFLSKATGSLYIATSQLILSEHHKKYFGIEISSVQNKEKLISLEEFKNKKSIELPNNVNKGLELPSKKEKSISTIAEFIEEISKPNITADDIVKIAIELATKMNQQKNNINNTLKPKPTLNQQNDKK